MEGGGPLRRAGRTGLSSTRPLCFEVAAWRRALRVRNLRMEVLLPLRGRRVMVNVSVVVVRECVLQGGEVEGLLLGLLLRRGLLKLLA